MIRRRPLTVVALAAREKHVDDDPQVKRRQDYFNEKALRDVYWVQLMQDKVTDEAAKAYYEETIAKAPAEQEANARHILVQSEAVRPNALSFIRRTASSSGTRRRNRKRSSCTAPSPSG